MVFPIAAEKRITLLGTFQQTRCLNWQGNGSISTSNGKLHLQFNSLLLKKHTQIIEQKYFFITYYIKNIFFNFFLQLIKYRCITLPICQCHVVKKRCVLNFMKHWAHDFVCPFPFLPYSIFPFYPFIYMHITIYI